MSLFDYLPIGTRVRFKEDAPIHAGRVGTVRQHLYLRSRPACFFTPDEGDSKYWHSYDAWDLDWFEKLGGQSPVAEQARNISLRRFTGLLEE